MNESSDVEKFKSFLKEIFRIDLQDLDFGIYKIMKIKQDMIQKFIDDDLIRIADSVISEFPDKDQNLMTDVFNLSYEFLSRYYSNGDFIPQIRYGGRDKYMIPYNGQEVELYWATRNSYYVKTTEYFTNYSFIVYDPFNPDDKFKVNFKIKEADLDKNYVASEKKYFFIAEDPIFIRDKEADIFFNYRPIRNDESEVFQGNENTIRDTVKQKAEETILNVVPNNLSEILSRKTTENETNRSIIRRHIDIYFKKNESDYFIVKNLRKFLDAELANFIKNEILKIDNDFNVIESNRYLAKNVSSMCQQIIKQISEIEDFELKLWEKKKFVFNVNYVITLSRIANKENGLRTIRNILNHKGIAEQINEWKEIGIIGNDFNQKSIILEKLDGMELDQHYATLPIDTKFFKELEFEILALFNDLDNEMDGWLIHSENYQALNTILPLFKEKIQTIYIDPPFNTGSDFSYKDEYQDSTWLTLMDNRIAVSHNFLKNSGSILLHLDHNADHYGRIILDKNFGKENFINEIIWRMGWVSGYKTQVSAFVRNHDVIFYYAKNSQDVLFNKGDSKIPYQSFDKDTIKPELETILKKWDIEKESIRNIKINIKNNKNFVYKIGLVTKDGEYNIEDTWNSSEYEDLNSNKIKRNAKEYTPNGSKITQKPEELLKRIIELTSKKDQIILDFFLGTATSAAVAHKLGRKWVGIEVGDYFYTDCLWRMKHVLAGFGNHESCGISKEINWSGGGFFKYFNLEQYEDSLNNIEIREKGLDEAKLKPHIVEYILKYGTLESKIFVNKEMLSDPFNIKMRIVDGGIEEEATMNLIETFNLWYGVNVEKVVSVDDRDRRYVFIKGRKDRQGVIIIWRNTKDLDFIAEKDFIMEKLRKDFNIEDDSQGSTKVLFNNDCALDLSVNNIEVKSLDPIFFELQWDGLSAE